MAEIVMLPDKKIPFFQLRVGVRHSTAQQSISKTANLNQIQGSVCFKKT